MSGAKVFLDTNVLVYTLDFGAPKKQRLALTLANATQESRRGVVSYQVLQEFVNVMRRGQSPRLGVAACELVVEEMSDSFEVVPSSRELLLLGLRVQERFGISWFDSLIVAAAQSADCATLYSEDLSAGQAYGSLRVVNPFAV